MATSTIDAGGTITLGDLTVHRLDLGAMRISNSDPSQLQRSLDIKTGANNTNQKSVTQRVSAL